MDYRLSHAMGTNMLLQTSLNDILFSIKPVEGDQVKRLNTINELTTLVQSVSSLKGASVKPFGSFVSNLFTKWGDLDISIELSPHLCLPVGRKRKQNLLRDIMRALRSTGQYCNFQFIPWARVPLLIVESRFRNISCDISIDNHIGQIKSKILFWITEMDDRFRDMVLLTKEWAKTNNINDPKAGTLNSYSLCLLVIFHFQTCSPAILPPLKDIYEGNTVNNITGTRFITERNIEDICAANIAKFRSRNFSRRNESSLSELLISFFEKFSTIGTISPHWAICTYTGRCENISSKHAWTEKPYKLVIEDPFELPDNAARAVGASELITISNAFAVTHRKLSTPSVLSDREALLCSLARPHIRSQIGRAPPQHHYSARQSSRDGAEVLRSTGLLPLVEQLSDQLQSALRRDNISRPSSSSSTVSSSSSSTVFQQSQDAVRTQSQIWRQR